MNSDGNARLLAKATCSGSPAVTIVHDLIRVADVVVVAGRAKRERDDAAEVRYRR